MLKLSRLCVALGIAIVSGLTFGFVSGKMDPQTRYQGAVQRIDAQFQKAQSRCQTLPQGQLHLCLALALSDKWRAVADAQLKLHDTPETRRSQRVSSATGDLLVALQKCTARALSERSACRDSAKGAFLRQLTRARAPQAREQPC